MDISKILEKVKSGGFQNPIRNGVMDSMATFKTYTVDELTALANAQHLVNPSVPFPTGGQIETLAQSIIGIENSIKSLLDHSDRISGVNLAGNGTIATIARTMNAAKNINGEKSCSTVLAAFGAIQNAADLVTSTVDTITAVKKIIDDIPGQIATMPSVLANYATTITSQIAADVGVLAQAKLNVIEHAISNSLVELLQDECASQILSAVMTNDLKNEVNTVISKTKADADSAIYGLLKK